MVSGGEDSLNHANDELKFPQKPDQLMMTPTSAVNERYPGITRETDVDFRIVVT